MSTETLVDQEVSGQARDYGAGAVLVASALTVLHLVVSASSGLTRLEPFGLIHSMPITFFVAVAAWAVALVVLLLASQERGLLLGLTIAGLTTALHGTAAVLEPTARFPTSWLHAGYVQYMLDRQDVLPEMGARFSWPGFFGLAASTIGPSSATVPVAVLRWAPLFFCLAYLPPLLVIGRQLLPGWRAPWLSVALFPLVNWVGQDYFAPQSFALLLALVVLAVTLTWLTDTPRPRAVPRVDEWEAVGQREPARVVPHLTARPTILIVGAITTMSAALAVSHQLTPYVLALQLLVIWAFRRGQALLVGLVVGLVALIWLSWGATTFWVPWFSDVFGSIGDPVGVVDSTLGERTDAVNPQHLAVLALRLAFTGLIFLGGLVGLARRYQSGGGLDRVIPAAALVPFALILVQPYGGEGLLRAYLYATPFLAVALTGVFLPGRLLSRVAAVALVLSITAASVGFLIARYGNESFERVTLQELSLAQCMYEAAPEGSTLIAVSPHLAWQFRDIAAHQHVYRNAVTFDGPQVDDFLELAGPTRESFLIVTEPQVRFVERSLGARAGWGDDFTEAAAADDRLTRICANPGGSVYRVDLDGAANEEDD